MANKKKLLSLILAVMFIMSIISPVYAVVPGEDAYNEEAFFEEYTSYDAIVKRFPEATSLLISKAEAELLQSDTAAGRALQAQYASNVDKSLVETFEDRAGELDVMYLDVYDDGTYAVYGLGSPDYGSSGGSYVTEDGYVKYSDVKVYAKHILFASNLSSTNYGGQMYYYVDFWKLANGNDRIVKDATGIYANGSYTSSLGVVQTIYSNTKSVSNTTTKATGKVDVYQSTTDSGTDTKFTTVSLIFTVDTSGTRVSMSGI